MTTAVFQWATTLLVFWIVASDALLCYECSFFSKDVNAYSNCTDPAANPASVPTCEGKSCAKYVVKCTEPTVECNNDTGISLSRGCSEAALDNAVCCSSSFSSGKAKVTNCVCTEDKCNVGKSVLKSASLVVLVPLAFVTCIASFIGAN